MTAPPFPHAACQRFGTSIAQLQAQAMELPPRTRAIAMRTLSELGDKFQLAVSDDLRRWTE